MDLDTDAHPLFVDRGTAGVAVGAGTLLGRELFETVESGFLVCIPEVVALDPVDPFDMSTSLDGFDGVCNPDLETPVRVMDDFAIETPGGGGGGGGGRGPALDDDGRGGGGGGSCGSKLDFTTVGAGADFSVAGVL